MTTAEEIAKQEMLTPIEPLVYNGFGYVTMLNAYQRLALILRTNSLDIIAMDLTPGGIRVRFWFVFP